MGPNLSIVIQDLDEKSNSQVVKFTGEFDKAGHIEIREELDKFVEGFSLKSMIFDFSELKFINSEGIGYLMEIHAHLVQRDRQLVIVGPNSHVNDVFKAIGLSEIIPLFNCVNDFLKNNS